MATVCIVVGTSGAPLTNNTYRAVLRVFYFLTNCLYFYHLYPWFISLFWDTKTGKYQLGALGSPINGCNCKTLGKALMADMHGSQADLTPVPAHPVCVTLSRF